MIVLTSTLPNFPFGKFSVARKIIVDGRSHQAERPLVMWFYGRSEHARIHNILCICVDLRISSII